MKNKIVLFGLSLAFAGCQSAQNPAGPSAPPPRLPSPVSITASQLDPNNLEKVRTGDALKAYPLGRYVDPNDPSVMHEAHTIYRREAAASWNLNPNAPTVVPLGPVLAIADPAKTPNPLPAELEEKIAEQNHLMATLVEQNEALSAELSKLNRQMTELRGKQDAQPFEGKK